MTSLIDIIPLRGSVKVQGQDIEVVPINAATIAVLLQDYEELRRVFSGQSWNAETLMKLAPSAIASIIAAGVGHPGDKDYEKRAADLSVEDQFNILMEIYRVTLPNGHGPFVASLERMGLLGAADAESGKVRVSKSPQPSKS